MEPTIKSHVLVDILPAQEMGEFGEFEVIVTSWLNRKTHEMSWRVYPAYEKSALIASKAEQDAIGSSVVVEGNEPTSEEIQVFLDANPHHSFYTAREELRDLSYGGSSKSLTESQDWGTYWKSY